MSTAAKEFGWCVGAVVVYLWKAQKADHDRIWRFPKIGDTLNHPSHETIVVLTAMILWGSRHFWKPPFDIKTIHLGLPFWATPRLLFFYPIYPLRGIQDVGGNSVKLIPKTKRNIRHAETQRRFFLVLCDQPNQNHVSWPEDWLIFHQQWWSIAVNGIQ